MINNIISFSGGIGSWLAAKRVADKHGTDNLYLVFTDVLIEDDDLYRFLKEAADNIGGELVWLKDGRDPWDIFREKRYMGNTRTAHCSEELKSNPFYKWVDDFMAVHKNEEVIIYLGIDWTEEHRLVNAKNRRPEYKIEAPLCEKPLLTRKQMFSELEASGIASPKLYRLGFSHNNCGGCCVKAGQGQWARVLSEMPDRYLEFEQRQEKLMQDIPTTRPFLRMTIDGKMNYLSLKDFRKKIEAKAQIDIFDIGGCGCFLE